MSYLASLGMLLSAAAVLPDADHATVVYHALGTTQVEYRGNVALEHRQVGSVAPGGRPPTLRCIWTANLRVDRVATHISGSTASRSFVHKDVARGHHPGWCPGNSSSRGGNLATRVPEIDKPLQKAIAADQATLMAELNRLGPQRSEQ